MEGGDKEIGEQSQIHSVMRQQLMTQHKVPRTNERIPPIKASGKKFLEEYMNGPRH